MEEKIDNKEKLRGLMGRERIFTSPIGMEQERKEVRLGA